MPRIWLVLVTFVAIFASRIYGPLKQKAITIGYLERDAPNIHGNKIVQVPGTYQCEDIHHHVRSGRLFAACEEGAKNLHRRRHWFPPLGQLDASFAHGQGSIVVIDPKTFRSTRLKLKNFPGPFVTHGIDVLTYPRSPRQVYIFAINHIPHPLAALPTQAVKASSQIEVFSHTIGTSYATRLRSVAHPSIRTPNDLYATSPNSFYVTNDHYYREGPMRTVEGLGWRGIAGWTNTLHVTFDETTGNASAGVVVTEALTGLHNNNGLAHSEYEDVVLIASASSGEVTLAKRNLDPILDPKLEVLEHLQLDTAIDNPSYYHDEWATPGNNASGYVLAGLTNGLVLKEDVADRSRVSPSTVWFVKRKGGWTGEKVASAYGGGAFGWRSGPRVDDRRWNKTILFQDDGKIASTAATAVMVGIDPKRNWGKKRAWLFVTGFLSRSVTATLVDL